MIGSEEIYCPAVVFLRTLQGYYQEAGRAGRDGRPSECILLFAKRDIPRIVRMLRRGRGSSKAKFEKGVALLNQVPSPSR
jgi:bloom syndrome protein